jgi:hypothetical protein
MRFFIAAKVPRFPDFVKESLTLFGPSSPADGRAAASYWRIFRDIGLRERTNGNLPRSWLRFAQRNKGAAFLGNKHASHPINAMLNYCYIVEAGRLAKALAAQGLCLSIGYLHSDKKFSGLGCYRAAAPGYRRQGLRVHCPA